MGFIGVITNLLTIDPNFQRDIQVGASCIACHLKELCRRATGPSEWLGLAAARSELKLKDLVGLLPNNHRFSY